MTHNTNERHPGGAESKHLLEPRAMKTTHPPSARCKKALAMTLGSIALLLVSAIAGHSQVTEDFRIGVSNTFLRSPGMYCLQSPVNFPDCMVQYQPVPTNNAREVAKDLLEEDLDVIVLNEVFDEPAREILIDKLSGKYPHFVSKIDDEEIIIEFDFEDFEIDSITLNGEDSGLMIFSRFPFLQLPDPQFKWKSDRLEGTTDEVAFIVFEETASDDALAAKGVGLVRVTNPDTGAIYAIAFSHMQADTGGEHFPDVRKAQFADAEELITTTLGLSPIDHIFLTGDLNVRGEGGVIDAGTAQDGTDEWQDRFGNDFFFETMIDTWAATTSMEDTGITNYGSLGSSDDDQRLDYIAADVASLEEGWCVQHLRRREVAESDHLFVRADYNIANPLCDPRRAWQNPPLDDYVNFQTFQVDVTEIAAPGGAQWFYYDLSTPGSSGERHTVSIGIPKQDQFDPATEAGVILELFDPSDLSTPISQYMKEETNLSTLLDLREDLTGVVHVVPERFFLKISSPNPMWTGNYTFLVHEHTCASQEDACVLLPNENPRTIAKFDPNSYVGQEDTMWFRIDVAEEADSGNPQVIRAFAGPFDNKNFGVALLDADDPSNTVANPPLTKDLVDYQEFEGEIFGLQSMFLIVKRHDATLGDALEVGWDTNLTRLHGEEHPNGGLWSGASYWRSELRCKDETNPELGSDEIHLLVSTDNGPWQEIFFAEYECNDGDVYKDIEDALGTRRFVDNIRFKIVEEDGSVNPDDVGPTATIQTMVPEEMVRPRQFIFWEFESGRYEMKFNMSRGQP